MATWQTSFWGALKHLAVVAGGILGILGILSVHDVFVDTALPDSQPTTRNRTSSPPSNVTFRPFYWSRDS